MTKIVGHRGAAGIELENTIPSFRAAKKLGVDAIELDIQVTADDQFVVCHDDSLVRVSGTPQRISALTWKQLSKVKLNNGAFVPLLTEVLAEIDKIPVVLDIKTDRNLPALMRAIDDYPDMNFTIVTPIANVVTIAKALRPDIPAFIQRRYTPFGFMKSVKRLGADGLNLNYLLLNPITYRSMKKRGLQIQVYTVNNVHVARIIKRLYPGIWICTNHPDKFLEALPSDSQIQAAAGIKPLTDNPTNPDKA